MADEENKGEDADQEEESFLDTRCLHLELEGGGDAWIPWELVDKSFTNSPPLVALPYHENPKDRLLHIKFTKEDGTDLDDSHTRQTPSSDHDLSVKYLKYH